MNKKKVSVIVPVYNVEKYFEKCIKSLVDQMYENVEIIVVIDGSLDGCESIALKYSKNDNRIKVIKTENRGAALAKQIGLENSTGDYLMFIDGDDFIEKLSIIELIDFTEKYNMVDVISFGYQRVFFNGEIKNETIGKKIKKEYVEVEKEEIKNILGSFLSLFGQGVSNKFIKKKFIDENKIRFENDYQNQSEDLYFSYQLLFSNPKVGILNKPFYNYVQRQDSALNNQISGIGKRYLQLYNRIYEKMLLLDKEKQDKFINILVWLSYYLTMFIFYNWSNNSYLWYKNEFKDYKKDDLFLKLSEIGHKNFIKLDTETKNQKKVRKLFYFFFYKKKYEMCVFFLYIRFSVTQRLKSVLYKKNFKIRRN